jgi:anti-sigma factor RsiW
MSKPSKSSGCSPENLTLFHYGDMEETERLRVENHLEQCGTCRHELEQLEAVLALLPREERKISPEELGAFSRRLNQRLRPPQRYRFKPALGWSLAAATATLLLVTLHPLSPVQRQLFPGDAPQIGAARQGLPDPDLLLNMELLEKLDLLQELEGPGANG